MSLIKTTTCIYCGATVTGESVVAQKDSFKIASAASRVFGTLSGILSGDPISTYRHASGKSEEGLAKGTEKICGGGLYKFHCNNCNQEFEKRVY